MGKGQGSSLGTGFGTRRSIGQAAHSVHHLLCLSLSDNLGDVLVHAVDDIGDRRHIGIRHLPVAEGSESVVGDSYVRQDVSDGADKSVPERKARERGRIGLARCALGLPLRRNHFRTRYNTCGPGDVGGLSSVLVRGSGSRVSSPGGGHDRRPRKLETLLWPSSQQSTASSRHLDDNEVVASLATKVDAAGVAGIAFKISFRLGFACVSGRAVIIHVQLGSGL